MTKYEQTEGELVKHLKEQVTFMKSSAASYDKGFEGEAKRLAIAIRILLHDTAKSISLITQLSSNKKDLLFFDSATVYKPENPIPSNCLTLMKMGANGTSFIAPLDNLSPARSKKWIGFERWWERNTICRDEQGNIFNRKKLVLSVADQDGGAHIDPKLDTAYANLSRFSSLGWKSVVNGETRGFNNASVLPSIRQIAYEVLLTLKRHYKELF